MACPLFIPSNPLGDLVTVPAPLGDLYAGTCEADQQVVIDADTLRRYCNFGYARGHCERAASDDSDAVRLMVRAERGSKVEIAWAVERNHHPVAVGVTEIDTNINQPAPDDPVARHARACAAAYLRQSHSRLVCVDQNSATAHP